jgi:adenylate kinase family enzyme
MAAERCMGEHRIHILGGSGSGTTTLGRNLAQALDCLHADTDSFFWLPSDPPFQNIRPEAERVALLAGALEGAAAWVLSGSATRWGDFLIPRFTCVVWIKLPAEERLRRLAARERQRNGARIEPGGDRHASYLEFVAWAAEYDSERLDMRTHARHERWVQGLMCPLLRLDGLLTPKEQVRTVLETIGAAL